MLNTKRYSLDYNFKVGSNWYKKHYEFDSNDLKRILDLIIENPNDLELIKLEIINNNE